MYIHVKALTKQKKEYIKELKRDPGSGSGTCFEVSVKEKAENNAANKRIIEVLREHFGKNNIKIVNGHKNPSKLISIN